MNPRGGRRLSYMAAEAVVLFVREDVEFVLGRLSPTTADLALADHLARMQLAAKRLGGCIRIREASRTLCDLLELVGLSEVLGVEPWREAEGSEEIGVQEVVDDGDPSA